MSNQVRFHLEISTERLLSYYRGAAHQVVTTAHDGRRIRFPAEVLRPFVTRDGVCGEFLLRFDENNRFLGIERVG